VTTLENCGNHVINEWATWVDSSRGWSYT